MSEMVFPMSMVVVPHGPCSAEHHTRALVFPAREAAALTLSALLIRARSVPNSLMSAASDFGGEGDFRSTA
jgi:hypothetical protein